MVGGNILPLPTIAENNMAGNKEIKVYPAYDDIPKMIFATIYGKLIYLDEIHRGVYQAREYVPPKEEPKEEPKEPLKE
jgi:hypothetical protein